jgi:hypothetical protein
VQRVQNTDEGNEPKQDDTGRESKVSRSLMAHPELPFRDDHRRKLREGGKSRCAVDHPREVHRVMIQVGAMN